MPGAPLSSSISTLRAALAGPHPAIRKAALEVIRAAVRDAETWGEAAERLGVSRRALERLRVDFPEIDRMRQG